MNVLLDTSFVLSCVKKRIDFFSQLEEQGFVVKVPHEVINELKDLRKTARHGDKTIIDTALALLSRPSVQKIKLGRRSVDEGLIFRASEGYHIATLDKGIKHKVSQRIVIFDAQNRVGIE